MNHNYNKLNIRIDIHYISDSFKFQTVNKLNINISKIFT